MHELRQQEPTQEEAIMILQRPSVSQQKLEVESGKCQGRRWRMRRRKCSSERNGVKSERKDPHGK